MCATSNPFVVWAGASHDIMKAEMDLPKYKNGLRRLRDRLDALVIEVCVCVRVCMYLLNCT